MERECDVAMQLTVVVGLKFQGRAHEDESVAVGESWITSRQLGKLGEAISLTYCHGLSVL